MWIWHARVVVGGDSCVAVREIPEPGRRSDNLPSWGKWNPVLWGRSCLVLVFHRGLMSLCRDIEVGNLELKV